MELSEARTSFLKLDSKPDPSRPANSFERHVQPCLAELLGTMLFVFIGCLSVIENPEGGGRLQPALVHGLAIIVLVSCFAEISGSHFNPAFTLAIYLCAGIKLRMVAPFIACQLAGGTLGAALAKVMTSGENFGKAHGGSFAMLQSDDQVGAAVMAEIAMTCLISLVLLLGAVNSRTKSPTAPVLVGLTVVFNIMAGGGVSGACLNPARAFGPALVSSYWVYHWVYWVGPVAGALIAVALVRLLVGDRTIRLIQK
ncbi:aquaporin-8-like [Synchiropus picturatus]